MKKNLFLLIPALALVFFVTSCSKDDNNNNSPTYNSPQGTWVGTGQYGAGTPTYAFSLTFKADGTVDIIGNNTTGVDNATGTWSIVADSVRAYYKYVSSSAFYTLSGKYSNNSNVMVGNIGLGTATSGIGTFSVTRQ